jgi:hypothetical protein
MLMSLQDAYSSPPDNNKPPNRQYHSTRPIYALQFQEWLPGREQLRITTHTPNICQCLLRSCAHVLHTCNPTCGPVFTWRMLYITQHSDMQD